MAGVAAQLSPETPPPGDGALSADADAGGPPWYDGAERRPACWPRATAELADAWGAIQATHLRRLSSVSEDGRAGENDHAIANWMGESAERALLGSCAKSLNGATSPLSRRRRRSSGGSGVTSTSEVASKDGAYRDLASTFEKRFEAMQAGIIGHIDRHMQVVAAAQFGRHAASLLAVGDTDGVAEPKAQPPAGVALGGALPADEEADVRRLSRRLLHVEAMLGRLLLGPPPQSEDGVGECAFASEEHFSRGIRAMDAREVAPMQELREQLDALSARCDLARAAQPVGSQASTGSPSSAATGATATGVTATGSAASATSPPGGAREAREVSTQAAWRAVPAAAAASGGRASCGRTSSPGAASQSVTASPVLGGSCRLRINAAPSPVRGHSAQAPAGRQHAAPQQHQAYTFGPPQPRVLSRMASKEGIARNASPPKVVRRSAVVCRSPSAETKCRVPAAAGASEERRLVRRCGNPPQRRAVASAAGAGGHGVPPAPVVDRAGEVERADAVPPQAPPPA